MDKAIIVDHVSYNNVLKDVSFTLQKGEFVGIVGVNSFEKTSILNIISGLIKPTSGFVSVLGYDPNERPFDFLKQISYLSNQKSHLCNDLLPIDILETTKEIYGLSDREFNKNLNELAQYIKDPRLLDSLIYKPKVLLLEASDFELENLYTYNTKNESTALLVAEKIDDLINLVRRIIILDQGKILFDGAIDEVVTKFATEKIIKAKLSMPVDEKVFAEIGTLKKYSYPYIYISVPRSVVSLAAAEMLQNFPIISLDIEELSMEQIIENIKL